MPCEEDLDVTAHAARVLPWLQGHPVVDNGLINIVQARADGHVSPGPGDRWYRMEHGQRLVGAAAWTPPRGPVLSTMPIESAQELADRLAGAHLPSVVGPTPVADAFAARYAERSGRLYRIGLDMAVLELTCVRRPATITGHLSAATSDDRELLIDWLRAFNSEALPYDPPADPTPVVDRGLGDPGRLWLWKDDRSAVSVLWLSRPAFGVVRVGAVYTPPSARGHGYASAAVAAACQASLDRGARACTLSTDLTNPTSNRIYQRIGFTRVGSAREWMFT
jgi:predicted GNAT family acetyltransferase